MALHDRHIDGLLDIANKSGRFRIKAVNATGRRTSKLLQMVQAAKDVGVVIFLQNFEDKPTGDLMRIAETGGGAVVFDE
jgi:hypothetical protein